MTTPTTPEFYQTVPPLARYIDRVGAKPNNFLRYIIKEDFGHYYRELCAIKLDRDGTITCSDDRYAPDAAERAAIKLAFESVQLPHSIETQPANVQNLMPLMRARQREGELSFFEFYNQRTGLLIMVQQKIEAPQGKKYHPWSYWSDGLWRPMEPDRDLPFWKPKQATNKNKIMVHEGAKAAKFVHDLVEREVKTHPWYEELKEYEHWGMIGGALSPHRADYQELWARNPERLVYVCDNDWPGKSALPTVSRKYGRGMDGVTFDDSFPPSWDMADPMPRPMFKDGRYIGKRLKDCMRSCTCATVEVQIGKKTIYKINPHFEKEWSHSSKPAAFVQNELPRELRGEEEFNNWVRAFSHVKNTAELLIASSTSKAARLVYDPSSPSGKAIGSANDDILNTYMRSEIKPLEGDCTPWEKYLKDTFPFERDLKELIRWCATAVVHPERKMKYGVLLISETQGVGKSTLASAVLRPLVGEWNYSAPPPNLIDSNYNGWCSHKTLVAIHEVHEQRKSNMYLRLKDVITEPTIEVHRKYMNEYTIQNWVHVLACSNSKRALQLHMGDRRWLVPRVAETKRSDEEWTAFHKWLEEDNGLRKIRWWFEQWLRDNGGPVSHGAEAPLTETKKEVILENYSPGMEFVSEFLEWLKENHGSQLVVLDVDLRQMIQDHLHKGHHTEKLERTGTLRDVAKNKGWFMIEQRVQNDWRRGKGARVYALTPDPELAALKIAKLEERVGTPVDVAARAREWRPM